MKTEISTKQKASNSVKGVVSGSLHQMRARNTYKEMKEELAKLKKDVSFREYVGYTQNLNTKNRCYKCDGKGCYKCK